MKRDEQIIPASPATCRFKIEKRWQIFTVSRKYVDAVLSHALTVYRRGLQQHDTIAVIVVFYH